MNGIKQSMTMKTTGVHDASPASVPGYFPLPLAHYVRQARFRSWVDWRRLLINPGVGALAALRGQFCSERGQVRAFWIFGVPHSGHMVVVNFVVVVVMDLPGWWNFSGLTEEESSNTSRADPRF